MHKLTTFFLYAFLADGLLALADLLCRRGGPGEMPNFLAVVVSLALAILGVLLFFGMILTPRLSKRMLLPPLGFLGFCILWGVLYGQRGLVFLSGAQVLLGLGIIIGFRNWENGGIQDFASRREGFTFRNFLGAGLLNGFLALCFVGVMVLGLAQRLRGKLEEATGRYVTVQRAGILLEERRFRRADREIRLISMIHVAKNGFYDEIARALPSGSKAVVLLEGISDRSGYLRGKLDYSNVANMLGFTAQQRSSFTEKAVKGLAASRAAAENATPDASDSAPLEYRRADMDTAEFSEGTLHWIQAFCELMQSASLKEAFAKYSLARKDFEQGATTVYDDLLSKRNDHLVGEIRQALGDHTVVIVPWGARHMPDVQREIERWGFVETERLRREAFRFENKTLVSFLTCVDAMPGAVGR